MAIVKLENAGDSLTWRIKKAETTAGKFGPQVKFESEEGDLLFISEPTALRQLERIPLGVADCAGETLVFSRDENRSGGKPYWGIRLAGAADRAGPSVRMPSPYQAPNIGKVKGLDDFPTEAYAAGVADPVPPPMDSDAPDWVTTPQPGEKRVQTASASQLERKVALANGYLDVLRFVKAANILQDEQAIQAAAATIWIAYDKAGLR